MDKNSKVLALKYRPQTFDDLIGQEVVAETIINSIKADKIPNAYLFTGIRGVGKTTIARIVAKALNCLNGFEKRVFGIISDLFSSFFSNKSKPMYLKSLLCILNKSSQTFLAVTP